MLPAQMAADEAESSLKPAALSNLRHPDRV